MANGTQVTIHRESFLNGDHTMKDRGGEEVEVTWDVVWATDASGKALFWAGLERGDQIFKRGELVFTAGQESA